MNQANAKRKNRRKTRVRGMNHPQEVGPCLGSLLKKEEEKLLACPVKNYTKDYIRKEYLKSGIRLSKKRVRELHIIHRNEVEIESKWGYIICAHSIIEQGLKSVIRQSNTLTPEEKAIDGSHRLDLILNAIDIRNPDIRKNLKRAHKKYRKEHPEHRRLIWADFDRSIGEITKFAHNLRYRYLEGDIHNRNELKPCIVIEHLHALADVAVDAGETKYMNDRAIAQIRMGIWDQYGDKYKRMRLRMEREEQQKEQSSS